MAATYPVPDYKTSAFAAPDYISLQQPTMPNVLDGLSVQRFGERST